MVGFNDPNKDFNDYSPSTEESVADYGTNPDNDTVSTGQSPGNEGRDEADLDIDQPTQTYPNAKMAAMASMVDCRPGTDGKLVSKTLLDHEPTGDAKDAKCLVVKTSIDKTDTLLRVETSPMMLNIINRELNNIEELRMESYAHNNMRVKMHNKTKNSIELKIYYITGKTRADATVKITLKNNVMTINHHVG